MKGWIKVHGASKTWQDKYLRAQDVYAIEEYTEDEKEGYKTFGCTLINDCYYVSETPKEVFALIEKAESEEVIVDSEEKLQAVIDRIEPQSDFYKGMALIKGYCSSLKNCKKCPLNGYRECPLKLSGRVPERWDLDNLYLTADTEEEA